MNQTIDYLRISVTDRCNLRCIYCSPKNKNLLPRAEILTHEEIIDVAKCAVGLGIKKIRITGGEPLLRRGLVKLIQGLSSSLKIEDLSLTTNGTLLKRYAYNLRSAGIKRVNVSLDTLNSEKYRRITRGDGAELRDVLEGIFEAIRVGLTPLKVNVVVMRGLNEEEILDFIKFGIEEEICLRFIEFMPFKGLDMYLSNKEVKNRIKRRFRLIPTDSPQGAGPAEYFQIGGSRCKVGFISPRSENMCKNCNRIRLTSDGKLRPCLLSNMEIDLKRALRAEDKKIAELFSFALRSKAKLHPSNEKLNRTMFQIGG